MDALNRPVEMIATCSPAGELCPARFRVEGADESESPSGSGRSAPRRRSITGAWRGTGFPVSRSSAGGCGPLSCATPSGTTAGCSGGFWTRSRSARASPNKKDVSCRSTRNLFYWALSVQRLSAARERITALCRLSAEDPAKPSPFQRRISSPSCQTAAMPHSPVPAGSRPKR